MLNKLKKQFFQSSIKKEEILGIDIGAKDIKMIEMSTNDHNHVSYSGRIPTPTGALDDGTIIQEDRVSKALHTLWEQSGTKVKKAATVISGKNVITRYIKLPKMTNKEVNSTLKWEAEKYLPIQGEVDFIIEHLILGEFIEKDIPYINVLLVAIPRSLSYLIYQVFLKAGLILVALEIEPLSLWRSIGTNVALSWDTRINFQNAFIGLDIGDRASTLTIFQDGILIFSRYIPIGGKDLTQKVVRACNLEFNAAQLIKEQDGDVELEMSERLNNTDHIALKQALEEGLNQLVEEIRRSIDYHNSLYPESIIQGIVLTGGTTKLKGMNSYLENELDMSVASGLGNYQLNNENKNLDGNHKKIDPAYAIAIGLALREVG